MYDLALLLEATILINFVRYKTGEKEVVLDPLVLFHKAIENSKPIMGTTGVRRGGKLFHVSCFNQ